MIFSWFDTREDRKFAVALAQFIMEEIPGEARVKEAKFAAKAQKALQKAARRLQDFKATHKLNPFKRAKLANSFLWALKDAGCPQAYADELTEWLTLRL